MKNLLIVLIVILALGSAGLKGFQEIYNPMVLKKETVDSKWQQILVIYQKRNDLIPKLEALVGQHMDHESTTYKEITELRSQIANPDEPKAISDSKLFNQFANQQQKISASVLKFIGVAEAYPNLVSNQSFQSLTTEITNVENEIYAHRAAYNESVKDYNSFVQYFPNSIIASVISGFGKKPYYDDIK